MTAAPLLDAMTNYAEGGRLGFHTPGHHRGKGFPAGFARLVEKYGPALDLTELPGLDNLAAPAGCIEESQRETARLTGAGSTYYLVNGATAGLEAAMLAMSGPDMTTILPAHCHTAIHRGLVLTGSMPIILPCRMDSEWGLPLGVDIKAAEVWLKAEVSGRLPDKALWISVNPTYHGLMADLAWEKNIAKARPDWRWLADEAHGAHLPFVNAGGAGGRAPGALAFGADAVVHSVHKMGTGMTQTGLLHSSRADLAGRLRQSVNIMQSTSPSYLLMASLDAWQAFLQNGGVSELRRADELARSLADGIKAIGGYRLWQDELPASMKTDPRKITLSSRELGIDGISLAEVLRHDYAIDVELATNEHILLIVGLGHDEADVCRMVKALASIGKAALAKGSKGSSERNRVIDKMYERGQKPWSPAISPREAFFSPREKVKLEASPGRLAAVTVAPYPPGVPVIFPGMEISKEAIEKIISIEGSGIRCAGLTRAGGAVFVDVVGETYSVSKQGVSP
ncbi:MAG: hypothetical protein FWG28_00980 [Clostridiales bacterium]|nr:hypothetical protein [Clostridiales bacterium]